MSEMGHMDTCGFLSREIQADEIEMSKITPLSRIRVAGTLEAPSSFRRNRCPACYYHLLPHLWKGKQCKCPNCGLLLVTTHDLTRSRNWLYFIENAKDRGIMWSLFYFFVWIPIQIFDRYLGLRRLSYWAILRLMT